MHTSTGVKQHPPETIATVAAIAVASTSSSAEEDPNSPMLQGRQNVSLEQPSGRPRGRPGRAIRLVRSLVHSFPVFSHRSLRPCTSLPSSFHSRNGSVSDGRGEQWRGISGKLVTGTIFGSGRGSVALCVQETPWCVPSMVLELAMETQHLLKEMSAGAVRIAMECEKKPPVHRDQKPPRLLKELSWTVFCNGMKNGQGLRRDATDEDLYVMESLRSVSMGAGVLPANPGGEIAYMRADFEHVVASKDSETLYMVKRRHCGDGPELTIFFVRI